MNKKYLIVYFLTVFSFSSVNFLNVTYSLIKRFIQTEFSMSSTQIAIADSLKFFGIILGLLLYILFDIDRKSNILLIYIISIVLYGLSIATIAISSIFHFNQKWIVFLFNIIGGLMKAPSWSLLLQLVNNKIFSNKLDSNLFEKGQSQLSKILIRFDQNKKRDRDFIMWNSLTLLGNIFGLVISQNLIYKAGFQWNICLLIPVGCIIVSSVLLGLYFNLLKENSESLMSSCQNKYVQTLQESGIKRMVLGCIRLLFLTRKCIFIWSLVFLLSIHSIIMMFLPLFLFKIGYDRYEGYILAWYNICVILGTFCFACINLESILNPQFYFEPKHDPQCLQQQAQSRTEQNQHSLKITKSNRRSLEILNTIFLLFLVGTSVILVVLPCSLKCSDQNMDVGIKISQVNQNSKVIWYFGAIGLFGFFLGGPLNMYESTELLLTFKLYEQQLKSTYEKLSKEKQQQINFTQQSQSAQKKSFIGIVQLISYFIVIIFLLLTGYIIQNSILAFFYLTSILSALILILNFLKIFIGQSKTKL